MAKRKLTPGASVVLSGGAVFRDIWKDPADHKHHWRGYLARAGKSSRFTIGGYYKFPIQQVVREMTPNELIVFTLEERSKGLWPAEPCQPRLEA